MSSMWRLGFISSVLLVSVIAVCRFDGALGSQNSEEAYVTLLYGDEFLLGVRVLGKSIRDTGSTKDMVALVSDGVSNYAKKLLQADGWIVKTISLLENPNQVRPTRFWGVYTKLKIFNMTEYKKVVYLDADTIVVKNIEDLFKCQKFCANLKHSERLNSGVMVVEPSEEVFKDMMTKVNTMYSYTGGDQGFLNSYFPDFANARIFDPYASAEELKSRPIPQMERLSTLYNADVGLYMLANKWMVDEAELRVIHYTLGPLKPWDWWTHWLVKPVDVWQSARIKLEETLPGTGGGQNPQDKLLITFLILLPLVFLVFCYYRSYLQTRSLFDHIRHIYYKLRSGGVLGYSSITSSTISTNQQLPNAANKVPIFLGAMSVVVCFMAALFSLALSFSIVPRQVMPWTGLLLVYEWTFTVFLISFGSYLHVVHHWGKHVANQTASFSSSPESLDNDSRKGHLREMSSCDVASCYYGLGMASLALAVPLLPSLLGVTALFLRLGLMVAGGLILASFMTYASEHLSTQFQPNTTHLPIKITTNQHVGKNKQNRDGRPSSLASLPQTLPREPPSPRHRKRCPEFNRHLAKNHYRLATTSAAERSAIARQDPPLRRHCKRRLEIPSPPPPRDPLALPHLAAQIRRFHRLKFESKVEFCMGNKMFQKICILQENEIDGEEFRVRSLTIVVLPLLKIFLQGK
ncbi:Inositol phosphorylceramide glucuronosyltransferase 1 [Sesamum alatum]|uniref:Hexosyltransferase n=1 Tax=Sesamum alatum TaxID=300844 RepID=A0AAE1YJF3_9LAMI|nr:Inositol phosphorylceramide glucuronosyltransferase 1 [Sesamum alatum]